MSAINITNVFKIGVNTYSVDFQVDFNIANLAYQTSLNGTDWSESVSLGSFSSPLIITVENLINFKIRLLSDYTPPTPIPIETGFLMINSNDKFLINDTDSLKYTN